MRTPQSSQNPGFALCSMSADDWAWRDSCSEPPAARTARPRPGPLRAGPRWSIDTGTDLAEGRRAGPREPGSPRGSGRHTVRASMRSLRTPTARRLPLRGRSRARCTRPGFRTRAARSPAGGTGHPSAGGTRARRASRAPRRRPPPRSRGPTSPSRRESSASSRRAMARMLGRSSGWKWTTRSKRLMSSKRNCR